MITEYTSPTESSQPTGITTGPDGNLWYTEFNNPNEFSGDNIATMPACGLGLRAKFAKGTLTIKMEPGINRPAIWTLDAGNGKGFIKTIAGMAPPKPFTFRYRNYPASGKVRITSKLSDQKGHEYCSEWTTVNTAK